MATTTLGVKLDDPTRERLKAAATSIDRTPHWLIKQAIFNYLEKLEGGATLTELNGSGLKDADDAGEVQNDHAHQCFLEFAESILPQSVLRASITAAYRRPEPEVVPMLIEQARLPAQMAEATNKLAASIAEKLRNQKSAGGRAGIVQGLLQEFSLSSQEGVALMCLAEALLRIPDKGTRDALIRDKISTGNWQPHLGNSPSLFVNAATWGLLLTGKLVATHNEAGLTSSLSRIIGKSGEPMIRKGVDMAMRLMGEQFVTGETIAEALANASKFEAKGFRYSYDMLGEAALTEHDAQKYLASYEQAIHSIGKASHGRGIYEGPGISIKLSALHPRYSRAQYERVMDELYPRLLSLTLAGQAIRHRPEHRRRRSRPPGAVPGPARAPVLRAATDRLERYRFRDPGLPEALPVRDRLRDRPGTPQPSPPDDPPGKRRVLGQRNQARPGRRPGRLPGLHPQGVHRRFLHRLRTQAAVGTGSHLPAVRHAQRPHPVGHLPHRRPELLPRPVRVPVPARHG
jgi:predicted transcriptional regulator